MRQSITDKIKGVDKLFITEEQKKEEKKFEDASALVSEQKHEEVNKQDNQQGNEQDREQDNEQVSEQGNEQDNNKSNKQDTTQYTNNVTNKYTIEKPAISELVNERLVANVTKSQKKYVKEMGKKFENESAFVRYMIDYFRQNIEIK